MHLETLSNGLGGQSMYLLWLAGQGRIPARVSITADTGSERDRLWNTGERTSAAEYFEQVVKPLADGWGVDACFVRAVTREGVPLPALEDYAKSFIHLGEGRKQMMPLHGTRRNARTGRMSRLRQTCTERWKVAAINQEGRRRGARTMRTAQGIHFGEAARRVKGDYIGSEGGFDIYRTVIVRKGVRHPVKWLTHYYPLVDLKMNREQVRAELERLGIPFLESSECDMCPHKDAARWLRTSPERLAELAEWEARYGGAFYFTDERVPLLEAVEQMRERRERNPGLFGEDPDFGCGNSHCGV